MEMMAFVPLYEGFLTYGGMDVRTMEALAQGLYESLDMEYINQGPEFIGYLAKELDSYGVPMILPAGGLGCHLNAGEFCPDLPHNQYPAAAVGAALYIASGIRGMERGTMSEQREPDGTEPFAALELLRLAVPRRVFTLSQIKYVADRVKWLWDNRVNHWLLLDYCNIRLRYCRSRQLLRQEGVLCFRLSCRSGSRFRGSSLQRRRIYGVLRLCVVGDVSCEKIHYICENR